MSNMLADGIEWLSNELVENASEPIVYYRGSEQIQLNATFGHKLLKLEDIEFGPRIQWTDMDFLIRTTDMVLGGNPIFPQRGDMIVVTMETSVQTFEVMAYGSDPPWRWSDSFQKIMRIHTKLINVQSAYGEYD